MAAAKLPLCVNVGRNEMPRAEPVSESVTVIAEPVADVIGRTAVVVRLGTALAAVVALNVVDQSAELLHVPLPPVQ
ncbi:MAG: hypothetical protein ACKONH_12865 [Planctomycetia bacterium]